MKSLICAVLCLLAGPVLAQSEAEVFGRRIAELAAEAGSEWRDLEVTVTMTLRDRSGVSGERTFRMLGSNGAGQVRTLIIVDAPTVLRNTALLTYAHQTKADEQWVYLPSLDAIRKIHRAGRSGSFVGSEFSYRDLVVQSPAEFRFIWLGDGPCPNGGGTCHVLDRFPRERGEIGHQRLWLELKTFQLRRVDYFGKGNTALKTLTLAGYRQYDNGVWRAASMSMRNLQTGRITDLTWSAFRFDTGIDPRLLTPEALRQLD